MFHVKQSFLFAVFAFSAVFFMPKIADAALIYSNTTSSGQLQNMLPGIASGAAVKLNPPPSAAEGYVSSVTLNLKTSEFMANSCGGGGCTIEGVSLCVRGVCSAMPSTFIKYSEWTAVTFNFEAEAVQLPLTADDSFGFTDTWWSRNALFVDVETFCGGYNACDAYNFTGSISSPGDYPVYFKEPEFSDGFESADFANWWVCVDLSTGSAGTSYGYFLNIGYGTSTVTTWLDDTRVSTSTPLYYPLDSLPKQECHTVPKGTDLPAGDYKAQASLFRHNEISGDALVASSTLINFSVIPGTKTTLPDSGAAQIVMVCQYDVSNTGVSTVDDTVNGIVNGGCQVLRYLFVPSQGDFQQFSKIWDRIKVKPPLGWFVTTSESLTAISEISSSTPVSNADLAAAKAELPDYSQLGFIWDVLDGGVAGLISFSFLMFLFNRLRHFDFHH